MPDPSKCPKCGRRGMKIEDKLYYCHFDRLQFDGEDDGDVTYGRPSKRLEREEAREERARERRGR